MSAYTAKFQDLIRRLQACKKDKLPYCIISAEECIYVAEEAEKVFASQPMLIQIEAPISICGDTHGQFYDVVRIFDSGGHPPNTNYLFLGDYVDRGKNSVEVLMLLFCYKVIYPNNLHLVRGNHEETRVNSTYGFLSECINRFNFDVYKAFNTAFNQMPVAAVISSRIICCHGGIIRDLQSLQEITDLERPMSTPNENPMVAQLLWSDPNREEDGWAESQRGAGMQFGKTPLWSYLDRFDLDVLARAHEVVQDGYEFFGNRRCVTIFSAPKYCDQFDNAGGIMLVSKDLTCTFMIIRPVTTDYPNTRVEIIGEDPAPSSRKSKTTKDLKTSSSVRKAQKSKSMRKCCTII